MVPHTQPVMRIRITLIPDPDPTFHFDQDPNPYSVADPHHFDSGSGSDFSL
jgi:hypothetical protein